jgi:putative oxygen-independent coproporphyrinogen III oxidase
VFESFGLYVHIPYCRAKCPYCDFNVHVVPRPPENRYVDALVAELARQAERPPFGGKRIATIYFGGGTPSLFAPRSIARILTACRGGFAVEPTAEISLEANPERVTAATLRGHRDAGINRLSFGIESFQSHVLRRLGRMQTTGETRIAVPAAREAGFGNVSLDLMFAVPGQSLADWTADLDLAVASGAEHLSAYNLTYEEGTPFDDLRRTGKLTPLADEVEAGMFEAARERLAGAGYRAYEISNFAKPGFESRHNRNYWRLGAYLGIGAGAHSHEPRGAGARRWSNERDPERYMRRVAIEGGAVESEETLERAAAAGEFVFLHLRTAEGLDERSFESRFGATLEELFPATRALIDDRLLEHVEPSSVRLTRRGLLVADSVCTAFV